MGELTHISWYDINRGTIDVLTDTHNEER